MQVPAVLMRGGTSRGLFFHETDLPADPGLRDRFLLAAYGSPDPYRRQVDGVGGATSSTSKVAIIADGRHLGVDVTYEFGQVSIEQPLVDRTGTCGNMSAAVGVFAVEEGMVTATDPVTVVRFLNVNTGKTVTAHVPTPGGRTDPTGDFAVPGVPGTGARIRLDYLHPGGAVTGSLLPTGQTVDKVDVPGVGAVEMSIVDAANPLLFVAWESLGLTGGEHPDEIDGDPELLARLESVRASAGVHIGTARSRADATARTPSVPKLALVGPPREYPLTDGSVQPGTGLTLRASMMSMGRLHRSYALSGAICTAVAASIPGTLVARAAGDAPAGAPAGAPSEASDGAPDGEIRIGHPSGVLPMTAHVERDGSGWAVPVVSGYRTARRLMAGEVVVPDAKVAAPA
jgi:2-methylaconitate cis-trans-isomerase PrpF